MKAEFTNSFKMVSHESKTVSHNFQHPNMLITRPPHNLLKYVLSHVGSENHLPAETPGNLKIIKDMFDFATFSPGRRKGEAF